MAGAEDGSSTTTPSQRAYASSSPKPVPGQGREKCYSVRWGSRYQATPSIDTQEEAPRQQTRARREKDALEKDAPD